MFLIFISRVYGLKGNLAGRVGGGGGKGREGCSNPVRDLNM
jgi:hypothetical protein